MPNIRTGTINLANIIETVSVPSAVTNKPVTVSNRGANTAKTNMSSRAAANTIIVICPFMCLSPL